MAILLDIRSPKNPPIAPRVILIFIYLHVLKMRIYSCCLFLPRCCVMPFLSRQSDCHPPLPTAGAEIITSVTDGERRRAQQLYFPSSALPTPAITSC